MLNELIITRIQLTLDSARVGAKDNTWFPCPSEQTIPDVEGSGSQE